MLTTQHIQEDLSRAYIQAVSARAGVNLSLGTLAHDYGVDGTFHQVTIRAYVDKAGEKRQRRLNSGFNLEFQCKASTEWFEEPDAIVYDLEAKTYNDLVQRAATQNATPLVLILMCLPRAEAEWFLLTENHLFLRKCCYWHRLTGSETGNTSQKRIRIPKAQLLDPTTVVDLLKRVERGTLR
jgi:hypothetical protein